MTDESGIRRAVPVAVRQVRDALKREFAEYIDLGDQQSLYPEAVREQAFLTRALAAKAARMVTGCEPEEAADAVVDGPGDMGIDAVACSLATPELWLIQAKWSDQGRARLATADILKLVDALRRLADLQYEQFNTRFQRLVYRVDKVLTAPNCRIHLVLATLGDGHLNAEAESRISDVVAEFGFLDDSLLDVRVLGIADFHAAIHRDITSAPVSVTATLSGGWHTNITPYQSYVGTVAVEELANWYQEHGDRLYDRNVRRYLGMTSVNDALMTSLVSNPHEFWYFNNGVTVLCDAIQTEFFSRRAVGNPVRLKLINAQVVNGAQTVTSAFHALGQAPEVVAEALVAIRVICVGGASEDLSQRIAKATNTQNRIEARDFVALDVRQERIREDFALSLGKSYVYKRGELEPLPAAGCSLFEAARALACAYPDSALVARLRRNHDYLWDSSPEGAYTRLFSCQPSAMQIWRSVQLLRTVSQELEDMATGLSGRARALTHTGVLLVAHIVFQLVGVDDIDEPGSDWESRMDTVLGRTSNIISVLMSLVDQLYGPTAFLSATFGNERKCRELAGTALQILADGVDSASTSLPLLTPELDQQSKPNSVRLLVERGRIADGAQLVYRPNAAEERALGEWLSEDPRRYLATWVNDPRKPLVWAMDGLRYSPSALVMRIWRAADWADAPVAVNGPRFWHLPGTGSLAELASNILAADAVRKVTVPVRTDRRIVDDRYELRDKLGSGAMGQIWRAYDRQLRRSVALKIIHPHRLAASEDRESLEELVERREGR